MWLEFLWKLFEAPLIGESGAVVCSRYVSLPSLPRQEIAAGCSQVQVRMLACSCTFLLHDSPVGHVKLPKAKTGGTNAASTSHALSLGKMLSAPFATNSASFKFGI